MRILVSIVFYTLIFASPAKADEVSIPLVACQMDVQGSPLPKLPDGKKVVQMDKKDADRLAYYETKLGDHIFGVYAPRGWHCYGGDGSGGYGLTVSPEVITAENHLSSEWKGLTQPIIEVGGLYYDSSSRVDICRIFVRAFPKEKSCADYLIKDWDRKANDFPSGPYPKDHILHIDDTFVEYETPAHEDGFGTDGGEAGIKKTDLPIHGFFIQRKKSDALGYGVVRLPADMSDLHSVIIKQYEAEQ